MATRDAAQPLSDRERAILGFEADWRAHEGGKAAAIRDRFGISAARYHQLLGRIVRLDAAAAHDPLLVLRLRRRARQRARTAATGRPAERTR